MATFIERRTSYRLPYPSKLIFTDGKESRTSYAVNISRGGLFILTMNPFPIDTLLKILFCLEDKGTSLTVQGKVVHVVYDKQRCEIECGMGIQFQSLTNAQKDAVHQYIAQSKLTYLELKRVLSPERPSPSELQRLMNKLPQNKQDLTYLRYRIDRVCTLFENEEANLSTPAVKKSA